jgi:hypothetical protein
LGKKKANVIPSNSRTNSNSSTLSGGDNTASNPGSNFSSPILEKKDPLNRVASPPPPSSRAGGKAAALLGIAVASDAVNRQNDRDASLKRRSMNVTALSRTNSARSDSSLGVRGGIPNFPCTRADLSSNILCVSDFLSFMCGHLVRELTFKAY